MAFITNSNLFSIEQLDYNILILLGTLVISIIYYGMKAIYSYLII